MAGFIGRYEHSLDPKGRVILPAKLRASFDTAAFLSHHMDRCLALWTPDAFAELMEQMKGRQHLDSERASVRLWASNSVEVELDRQGRLAIPQYLRTFAGLENEKPVLITGAIDHIELWAPEEFAARVQPAEITWTTTAPPETAPAI